MAKMSSSCKKNNGIVKLNSVAKKLQKSLLLGKRSANYYYNDNGDVPKGHFAVVAMGREESRRYVVPLCLLYHPTFLNLLEKAADEYGFDCEGVITIPCRPSEFERILAAASA